MQRGRRSLAEARGEEKCVSMSRRERTTRLRFRSLLDPHEREAETALRSLIRLYVGEKEVCCRLRVSATDHGAKAGEATALYDLDDFGFMLHDQADDIYDALLCGAVDGNLPQVTLHISVSHQQISF